MWAQVVVVSMLVSAAASRPLEWEFEDSLAPAAATMDSVTVNDNGASSFLQVTTGGHPLECDCERVKCNCVKRCECGLPPAAQNRQATAFLELQSATGLTHDTTVGLMVDMDSSECFLETGVSVGQDAHHMLDCECDKVKCNCVKHCECSLPAASTAAQQLVQTGEGKAANAKDTTLLEMSEGTGNDGPAAENDVTPGPAVEAKPDGVDEEKSDDDDDDDAQSTGDFLKKAGLENGPPEEVSKGRSKTGRHVGQTGKAVKKDEEDSYSYAGMSDNENEKNEYSYSYSNEED